MQFINPRQVLIVPHYQSQFTVSWSLNFQTKNRLFFPYFDWNKKLLYFKPVDGHKYNWTVLYGEMEYGIAQRFSMGNFNGNYCDPRECAVYWTEMDTGQLHALALHT